MGKNIAIIGAGISGIAAANILQNFGHTVTIFEKNEKIGGVWAVSYPNVRLQNSWHQYELANFSWTIKPDLHPTATQILQYFNDAVKQLKLDVRLSHEIVSMQELENGWQLEIKHNNTSQMLQFDYVVIAVGQYTEGKYRPQFPEQEKYTGKIVTERDVKDLEIFRDKQVTVVGFGKSALDMACFAVEQGAKVQHVFRTPRWTIPKKILGIHYSYPLFSRFGSVMMSSWAHPTPAERFLHQRLPFIVNSFWKMLAGVFALQFKMEGRGKDKSAQERLQLVLPKHPLTPDLRSALALAPDNYYRFVAEGKINPHQAAIDGFAETGIKLADGKVIESDVVVLSLGSQTPKFPYMPSPYREMLEKENDGVQLYRHLIHPRIPNLGFAGFNHGFMHIPSVEVGMIWLAALLNGDLKLPSIEVMEATIAHIQAWKREHINFEPSRSLAVNTRYQQYLDILLQDLKLNPYRKGWNFIGEIFWRYGGSDYKNVLKEYKAKIQQNKPLEPLPLET